MTHLSKLLKDQLRTFKSDFRDKWWHYLSNTKIKNGKQRHTDLSETDDITKERNNQRKKQGSNDWGVWKKPPLSMSVSSEECEVGSGGTKWTATHMCDGMMVKV